MAVTKLLRIKETKGRSKSAHLKNNINYICDLLKTEGGIYIGGNAGQTPRQIYNSMMMNKKLWNKEGGSQGFHYVLSFSPDSKVDGDLAFEIMKEFAKELLGDKYFYVFAIHNDKEHMHAHLTFDSVSRADGLKFHSPAGDWEKRIQPITDRLCKKYNLPTLEYDSGKTKGIDYGTWKSKDDRNKETFEWNDIIRDDIDEAIAESKTYEEFLKRLLDEHYIIKDDKFLSLHPPGKDTPIRTKYLGAGYGKEDILYRLSNKEQEKSFEIKTYGDIERIKRSIVVCIKRATFVKWQISGLQRKFYRRWMNTFFIRKPFFKNAWKHKQDILKVKECSDQLCYVLEHGIVNVKDLEKRSRLILDEREKIEKMLAPIVTKLFRKMVFKAIREYLKIKQELLEFPPNSRADLIDKLKEVKEEIEKAGKLDEVLNEYHELKHKYDSYKNKLRELNKEHTLCSTIGKETFEWYELDEKWIQTKYNEKDKLSGDDKYYTRVTINEKMFAESPRDGFVLCRIPFKKEYIYLPEQHTRKFGEGKILSTYLYHDMEYTIADSAGDELRKEYGMDVKHNYDDKTREFGKKKEREQLEHGGKEK